MKEGMNPYDLIADSYSEIFPLDRERVDFIQSLPLPAPLRVLDIGCSTGDLALAMANGNTQVTGIDLNERMINLARGKAELAGLPIRFQVLDMLALRRLPELEYELILSFGNTIPHLKSEGQVKNFFQEVWEKLAPGGFFLFQILNYDKILQAGRMNFPEIKTAAGIFRRRYRFPETGKVEFTVEWEGAAGSRSASMALLPLRQKQLLFLLGEAGFRNMKIYGDYRRSPGKPEDFYYLFVVHK